MRYTTPFLYALAASFATVQASPIQQLEARQDIDIGRFQEIFSSIKSILEKYKATPTAGGALPSATSVVISSAAATPKITGAPSATATATSVTKTSALSTSVSSPSPAPGTDDSDDSDVAPGAAVIDSKKKVFAHYMLGLTDGQTAARWREEIERAKAIGIDGFALNAGPKDGWTDAQLKLAYDTAASVPGFSVFVSFDMLCCGPWGVPKVSEIINRYKNHKGQTKVDGKPFVSTFEGPDFAQQWAEVKRQTGNIFLVPDWSSKGPQGIKPFADQGVIDGIFSWEAWKTSNTHNLNDVDRQYREAVGKKAYMMPVSPWFYTNLPEYGKNWLWPSDTLWFDRWEQAVKIQPEFIEIITWNDFGESHHIINSDGRNVVPGAKKYIDGIPHEGYQFVLPHYINSYKAGKMQEVTTEGATFWYRNSPKGACSDGGTKCGHSNISAKECVEDAVYVLTLAKKESTLTVKIGSKSSTHKVQKGAALTKVPFSGATGQVSIEINGKKGTGAQPIKNECANGLLNFNPVVGSTK